MPATAVKKKISIDYPRQHERITSGWYTIRVSAVLGEAERVLVSIDDAPFQPCRFAAGYWWFDWDGYRSHHHRLIAKIVSPEGEVVSEAARRFVVALGDEYAPATLDAFGRGADRRGQRVIGPGSLSSRMRARRGGREKPPAASSNARACGSPSRPISAACRPRRASCAASAGLDEGDVFYGGHRRHGAGPPPLHRGRSDRRGRAGDRPR